MTIAPIHDGWNAALALRFARAGGATRLVHRQHSGPLVLQKTLHPEGPELAQAVIVHPPGGIAGGDVLDITLEAGRGTRVQVLTPAATKWYRSAGPLARQSLRVVIEDGACFEWLPHESIVFDGAQASLLTRFDARGDASIAAWDIVCLGRRASGERFDRGRFHQRLELVRDGALVWVEQAALVASDPVLRSPVGLAGCSAFGTFLVSMPQIPESWLGSARAVGSNIAEADRAITRLPGVLLARCRGDDAEAIRDWFTALWRELRPEYAARPAVAPRLWAT